MDHLLEINHLDTTYTVHSEDRILVHDVSLHVDSGETLCLVGESGSGKSLTMLSVLGLLKNNGRITSGSIRFENQEIQNLTDRQLDKIRGSRISMIFQDALTSLNPVFTIRNQIEEIIDAHLKISGKERNEKMIDLLNKVGLSDQELILKKYPHELSGGQRQRVLIAIALACNPKVLIADEPTTALDVTIQAEIMNLLDRLKKKMNMALILITHDMGLVAQMADRVAVMYAGQIIEEAKVNDIFFCPKHPYTKALLQSIPDVGLSKSKKIEPIKGVVPENYYQIKGCRFAERCAFRQLTCTQNVQSLKKLQETSVRCQHAEQLPSGEQR
ncbi:ABC transporter ATP-binding protein [Sporolactobacillus pectinivorans]|uniref:ABC transporter ATP-binding protein n=1 Tax=Sporolactobacillus pectinivorans TaxID=1591408 RepID=UPI000C259F0E|nr:ABC transporter ATP-binding protein [Sporolactobacillus pectinivorans]